MEKKFNQSWLPKILPINREEEYHTHFLGKTDEGKLFFGYETFVFPNGIPSENWENSRKEYVVLYIFDKEGNLIETKHWCAGTTDKTSQEHNQKKLQEFINELGSYEFSNIAVKPFRTVIEGIEFGLIPNEETQSIEFQPSSTIAFYDPWDGEYDT